MNLQVSVNVPMQYIYICQILLSFQILGMIYYRVWLPFYKMECLFVTYFVFVLKMLFNVGPNFRIIPRQIIYWYAHLTLTFRWPSPFDNDLTTESCNLGILVFIVVAKWDHFELCLRQQTSHAVLTKTSNCSETDLSTTLIVKRYTCFGIHAAFNVCQVNGKNFYFSLVFCNKIHAGIV